jgi:hypothetical protein
VLSGVKRSEVRAQYAGRKVVQIESPAWWEEKAFGKPRQLFILIVGLAPTDYLGKLCRLQPAYKTWQHNFSLRSILEYCTELQLGQSTLPFSL